MNCVIFHLWIDYVILTHYNGICILVLVTMKMATRVTKHVRWLLCNKITVIRSREISVLCKI